MSARALITGLSGFTGQYMARELTAAGYDVYGLNLSPTRKVDLCDADSVRYAVNAIRPNIVVHLAAISFVAHGNAVDFYRVNLLGTRNLLAALVDVADGLDCVLLASSANIYGNRIAGMLTEESQADPLNDYAISKLAMEHMARLWMMALPIVIVRPFNYTGVGQSEHFVIPKIIAHFRRKATRIELGNLDVQRDFNDVRAICRAYTGLLRIRPAGEVFNISSGVAMSLRQVIAETEKIAGYKIDASVNPALIRTGEVNKLIGSAEHLLSVLPDWQPIPFRETLHWMYTN